MLNYLKKGWHGQLTFGQIFFNQGGLYLLEGGLAYLVFYILILTALFTGGFNFENLWLLPLMLYAVGFYIWLLKAFWGSANQSSNAFNAVMIRIFTILLPIVSIALFVFILLYYFVTAILELLN